MRNNNVTAVPGRRRPRRGSLGPRFLLHSLEDITAAVAERGHITLDERMTIRLASTFAIHTSLEVVDMLYQAAGATAIFNENPFERRFRDIHSVAAAAAGPAAAFRDRRPAPDGPGDRYGLVVDAGVGNFGGFSKDKYKIAFPATEPGPFIRVPGWL